MRASALLAKLSKRPFEPFMLIIDSGQEFLIRNPSKVSVDTKEDTISIELGDARNFEVRYPTEQDPPLEQSEPFEIN